VHNLSPALSSISRKVTVPLWGILGVACLQGLLAVACVLTLQQNGLLRERAQMYLKLAAPLVGRELPPLSGTDSLGRQEVVTYGGDGRPTLIYAFSKDCDACVKNWPAMQAVQRMSPQHLRVVYLNTADLLTSDYRRQHGIESDTVFQSLSAESAEHYRVRATPQAELVDSEGRVVWSRLGEFGEDGLKELIAAVGENTRSVKQEGDKP